MRGKEQTINDIKILRLKYGQRLWVKKGRKSDNNELTFFGHASNFDGTSSVLLWHFQTTQKKPHGECVEHL